MNLTRDRLQSISWAFILIIAGALTLALTFRVNAEKGRVRLAERQIVALEQDKMFLETEFETRANQQQLKALNDVDFGYEAPTSGQYLEGERQLAALGKPRGAGAPSPIRVASAADSQDAAPFMTMVSPLTGKAIAAEIPAGGLRKPSEAATLRERLSHVDKSAANASSATSASATSPRLHAVATARE